VTRLLPWLRAWAELLDSRFRIPGTNIRFGIDPILSLVPGIGELASPVFTALLIAQGIAQGVPKVVLARMVGNALLDALIGAVPAIGTVLDIFWRANTDNLALLEQHSHGGRQPTRGDYIFAAVLAGVLGLLVGIPVLLGIWATWQIWQWLR
jgi:hypothetical protein